MQQQKHSQQSMTGKRPRSDDHASTSKASNGNSSKAVSASQDGGYKTGNSSRGLPRKENATEFLRERFKRHNPGKTPALGSDSGTQGKGFPSRATLTPAEASLLKALTTDGAGGNYGVAGVSGLDRLMRVMINAPDVSVGSYQYPRLLSSISHRLQPLMS